MSTRLFPAKFNQNCRGCNETIKKGDPIGYYPTNTSPTCEACVDEGMPLMPDPRYKQDYGLPTYVRQALERRRNKDVEIWSLLNEKVDGRTLKTKLLVHIPDKSTTAEEKLKFILPKRTKMEKVTDLTGKVWWKVAKAHADTLIDGLQEHYAGVRVYRQFHAQEICTGSCRAADIEKTPVNECECSCLGKHHAGGSDNWINPVGDLLISNEVRQTETYYSTERNEIW